MRIKLNQGFIGLIILGIAVSFLYRPFFNYIWGGYTSQELSYFGAFISGAFGTIIGLIGIFLLYRTYKSQSDFNKRQIEESKVTRFENQFFQMINNFDNYINNLQDSGKIKEVEKTYNGISVIKEYVSSFLQYLNKQFTNIELSNHE